MSAKAFINFYAILLTTAVDIRPNRAERAGMSCSELRETLVPTIGLDDNRSRAIAVGDATARFEVVAPGRGVPTLREDARFGLIANLSSSPTLKRRSVHHRPPGRWSSTRPRGLH